MRNPIALLMLGAIRLYQLTLSPLFAYVFAVCG